MAITNGANLALIACFYNIEDSVESCLKGIVDQTNKEFEAILIDDGSTDSTAVKLDAYSQFENVRIIHSDNQGLSAARNLGISLTNADYITIVDGDDIISPYYIEALLEAKMRTNADMIIGNYKLIPQRKAHGYTSWEQPKSQKIFDLNGAYQALLYEEITESPCAKLMPRYLYLKYPFPEGRVYEEVSTINNYIKESLSFAYIPTPLYGYVLRAGSIAHRKEAAYHQAVEFKQAIDEFLETGLAINPEESDALAFRECLLLARLHSLLVLVTDDKTAANSMDVNLRNRMKQLLPTVINDKRVARKAKWRFRLLVKYPHLYDAAFTCYEKVIKQL